MAHFTTLGSDPRGNIQRIDNTLGSMESRLKTVQDQIATLQKEQEAAAMMLRRRAYFDGRNSKMVYAEMWESVVEMA